MDKNPGKQGNAKMSWVEERVKNLWTTQAPWWPFSYQIVKVVS